jgi:hypothetical protein
VGLAAETFPDKPGAKQGEAFLLEVGFPLEKGVKSYLSLIQRNGLKRGGNNENENLADLVSGFFPGRMRCGGVLRLSA